MVASLLRRGCSLSPRPALVALLLLVLLSSKLFTGQAHTMDELGLLVQQDCAVLDDGQGGECVTMIGTGDDDRLQEEESWVEGEQEDEEGDHYEDDEDDEDDYEDEEHDEDDFDDEDHEEEEEDDDEDDDEEYDPEDPNFCLDASCLNFGEEQDLDYYDDIAEECHQLHAQAREYLHNLATDPDTPLNIRHVLPRCTNRDVDCTIWAVEGRCEDEEERYHEDVDDMQTDCALACRSCDQLIYENRCPLDPENAVNAWGPGDLNHFFENITIQEKYQKWDPKVWSRPTYADGDDVQQVDYQLGPWVVSLENVFTNQEAERLIELGTDRGYARSDDWGEYLPDGTYKTYYHDGRTSHHTWCGGSCKEDPIVQGLLQRIEDITNISSENYENFQLLRYQHSQKYDVHHDYDSPDYYRQQGVRILTVFLYLSDVEEGGETHFPHLNLTFAPKRGRVVIWPNVRNDNPHEWDGRTEHAALPVIRGTKFAANSWVHQRDVQGTQARNCYE